MSRFNVRAIGTAGPPPPPSVPYDKKPSAYAAMKDGASNTVVYPSHTAEAAPEKIKRGRMTKDDARKHKMDMASAGIQVLVVSKPNRNKIREYIKNRILQLDDEKR